MTRKFSSTSVATTLASGINNTATSIVVATGTGSALMGGVILSPGNIDSFALALDVDTINEEIVWVTQISGDTLTVVRGQAGTTSIAHTAGASIKHVLTGDDATFFTTGVATANAAIPKNVATAKGDILVASASGVVDNLAVGSNNQVLAADATTTLGVKWTDVITPSSVLTINPKTTSYTLIATDLNKLVTVNSASIATITVPNGVFAIGSQINVTALGNGLVTIGSDGTTVLQATPGTVLRTKYSSATIICVATNTFLIVGDLSS